MNALWNKFRGYLHTIFVKSKSMLQVLINIQKGVEKKEERELLVKEHFCSESFEARSKMNSQNRAMLTMPPHIDSHPIREIIYQQFETEDIVKADTSLPSIEIVEKY